MPDTTRLDQFRLALSYLERIAGEHAHWDKLRAGQILDRTKYDNVRATYTEHLNRANAAVQRMRRDAEKEVPVAESLLTDARREQKKLIRRAASAKADPQALNAKNRELSTTISGLSEQLEELHLIVDAQSTGQLGGGVDLPLEEYPRRLDLLPKPPRISGKKLTPLQSNLVWGAVMLLLVMGTIGAIYLWRAAPHPEFSISIDDLATGFIVVECRNSGNREMFLYVPWPNGRATPLPGVSRASDSWGVNLSIRERDHAQLRLFEDAGEFWKLRGSYIDNTGPVSVRGGGVVRVALDLDRLRATGLEVEAVLVECTRTGGGVSLSREIELPAT